MHPLGASGLALAGSIGGWVLFVLTVKEVGTDKFMEIIGSRRSFYWIIGLLLLSILFYEVNLYLLEYIR
jgi:putative peptidoglycan lipid II flippase